MGAAPSSEDDEPYIAALSAVSTDPKVRHMPVEILPHLYLSNARCAHDIELLKARRITHVLNVAGYEARGNYRKYRDHGITVSELDARDIEGYPMLARHLGRVRKLVQAAKNANGKIVIHCVAGLNRSGVLCAAEYMLTTRCSVLDAVKHCRAKRGDLCVCNRSFQAQLVALARTEGLLPFEGLLPTLDPTR